MFSLSLSLSLSSLSSLVPSPFCVLFFSDKLFCETSFFVVLFPHSRARGKDKDGTAQADGQNIRLVCDEMTTILQQR